MATETFLKKGDTAPPFEATLRDGAGNPVDLAGATARFLMRLSRPPRGVVVVAPATITDAAGGRVRYAWVAADTARAGVFDAEVEITFSDTTIESFPASGFHRVVISDDVA